MRRRRLALIGVIILAVALPGLLKATTSVWRFFVGAEGRLAAITVDTNRPLGPLPRPWEALAQGGENLPTFLDGIETPIKTLRPKYIRIDHIYDEFEVVQKINGQLVFDWSRLDKVVGKIEEVGAKPFLSLSYMPKAIASGDLTSAPANWEEWAQLVEHTIEHYSGELKINGVYYEVWNEPDLFGGWRMGGNKDYKNLYLYAARGAQRAQGVQAFKLGGPGTTGLYRNWMDQFFPFILKNNLRLDFFSWHRYATNMDEYINDVTAVGSWLDKHPYFAQVEKMITEFGPDSKAGGANDTRMGAAHLVAVMRELMQKIEYGFTFAVNGSWGIVGKPRYSAMEMLAQLGEMRLGVTGEGTWVKAIAAQKDNHYQVILTNYDPKGIHTEIVPITFSGLKTNKFILREKYLGSNGKNISLATTAGILQYDLPMTPNSVAVLELLPVN